MYNLRNMKKKLSTTKDSVLEPNLTNQLDKDDLTIIGGIVYEGYERDNASRSAWLSRNEAGMNLALQLVQEKTFPWPNASNVVFPLVTIAALQFSARAYNSIIQGTEVVKYRIIGEDDTGDATERAQRIQTHMSWQVLEQDQAWEEQHDRLFINLGIVGTSFIKTYFDPRLRHNVSELVLAQDLVLNYYAKSVEACPRKTQILRLHKNEIYERAKRGTFDEAILDASWFTSVAVPLDQSPKRDARTGVTPPQADQDTPHDLLEQHCLLDLDKDGYAEPYVVTVERNSRQVLRIVSRIDDFDTQVELNRSKNIVSIVPSEYYTKYSFIPSPDGGIYDIGFGTLLGPLNEAVNTGINQLLDSGTMQNSLGGFLGRGAKIKGGNITMAPWEWKRVDASGDDLRKSLVPLPDRQPSVVVFQLLRLLIEYTDRVSGSNDTMVGVSPGQNTPAETTRTVVEQGMQIYSVVFKRVWRSMKEEFRKLHLLNGLYLPPEFTFGANKQKIRKEDYTSTDPTQAVPFADPHITSVGQRQQQATMLKAAAASTPGYDPEAVERRFLRAMQVDSINEVYPGPKKMPPPQDPKVVLEMRKLENKILDTQIKEKTRALTLAETARLNNAKIAQLEAQAMSLLQQSGIDRADLKLRAFDVLINAMHEQNRMILDFAKTAGETNDGQGSDQSGGVPGMAGGPSDAGAPGNDQAMGGGSEGSMG